MAVEVAGFGRSKCCLCSFAGLDLDVDANIANAKAVADIDTRQDKHNGLPYLHRDLAGLERKFLSRNFNSLRRALSTGQRGGRRSEQQTRRQNEQTKCLFSSDIRKIRATRFWPEAACVSSHLFKIQN